MDGLLGFYREVSFNFLISPLTPGCPTSSLQALKVSWMYESGSKNENYDKFLMVKIVVFPNTKSRCLDCCMIFPKVLREIKQQ